MWACDGECLGFICFKEQQGLHWKVMLFLFHILSEVNFLVSLEVDEAQTLINHHPCITNNVLPTELTPPYKYSIYRV